METPVSWPEPQPPEVASQPLGLESASASEPSLQNLSDHFVTLERLTGYIIGGVVLLATVVSTSPFIFFSGGSWWVIALSLAGWAGLAAFLLFCAHIHPRLVYQHTQWRLNAEGFEIRRGIIWRHRIAIPAARVQHVDVSQGPMQRMYALGKLTIHTAGTKNASIELDGLDHSLALAVRDDLITQKELLDDRN